MPKIRGFTKLDKTIANQNKKVYNSSMEGKGVTGKKYNDKYICGCFFDNMVKCKNIYFVYFQNVKFAFT